MTPVTKFLKPVYNEESSIVELKHNISNAQKQLLYVQKVMTNEHKSKLAKQSASRSTCSLRNETSVAANLNANEIDNFSVGFPNDASSNKMSTMKYELNQEKLINKYSFTEHEDHILREKVLNRTSLSSFHKFDSKHFS